jgi:hypothetical protein
MITKKILAVLMFSFFFQLFSAEAQDSIAKKKSPYSLNSDFVTSYLWRGMQISNVPNIQPYMSFAKGGFQAGAWGSLSINGEYSELDLNVSYTIRNLVLTVSDYFVLSDYQGDYFNYSNNTTGHSFEGSIMFKGTEKLPLQILAATFFYGSDVDYYGKRYYSTYFEATYSFPEIDLILGVSPWKSIYSSGFGVVNTGLRLNKEIKITKDISIPVNLSIIANPVDENIFLVAGFTL